MTATAAGGPPDAGLSRLPVAGPRVVGLGGGHGLAATLSAARRYASTITAVVSVADDGGSSGRLRQDLGMPAPGDVRRCLVALAGDPDGPWPAAFGRRFTEGFLTGHPLGNLVIAGLVETTGSFPAAVEEAGRLLDACGTVLPATSVPVVLAGEAGARRVEGQTAVEQMGPLDRISVEPEGAPSPPAVVGAIDAADQVVLGPGSLFTSVLAVTGVAAVAGALARRRASGRGGVVFVCNLKPSKETVGFDVAAHVAALAHHGVVPDVVLFDPAGIDPGPLGTGPGAPLAVATALARPNGWSHDIGKLGDALARLARG
jgi:uncharacterized cofD-like protein